MKIGISGYYGYQNLGDELFLKVWKELLSEHEVYALCGYENIESLDQIIIGGGDLLIPNFFTSAYWRPEFFKIPTWVYGVGVPTRLKALSETCANYRSFLARCEGVFLRDINSKKWVIEHGVHDNPVVVNDLAWAYKLPQVDFKKLRNKTLGVSIRPQSIFNENNVSRLIAEFSKDMDILLIPLQAGYDKSCNDLYLHQELKRNVLSQNPEASVNIIPPHADLDQRIKFIELVDLYITERMHGLLISLRVGTPVLPIAVGNKFYTLLAQFGQENIIVDSHDYKELLEKIKVVEDIDFSSKVNELERKSKKELAYFKNLVLNYSN